MKLLIVESPGKLKTLRKILGPGWMLEASVGHTTELAHDGVKNLGFEFKDQHVVTRYIPRGSRGKQVLARLKDAVKKASEIYLAMDPDREGESIAWHLVEQLRLKNYVRVSYTQITESAVRAAIQKPRRLDLPLIHAQRARQCLDKLVGFEVSPLLWRSSGGKSAGRVQSATLHLVCERERERLAFKPQDYWTLHSHYNGAEQLIAQYEPPASAKTPAIKSEEREIPKVTSLAEAKRVEAIARQNPHIISAVEERVEKRLPPAPLITSSLQQMASVRLRFSPQHTMKIAQELYEGVGGSGLITYMRTDAIVLSPEFVSDARQWLTANHPDGLAEKAPTFRAATNPAAQGAHEAIRPTEVSFTPELARGKLNQEQYQLYELIWNRAMASQCKAATLARGRIQVTAGSTVWVARGLRVVDPGYLKFWKNIEDERELPNLKQGQVLNLKDIKVEKKTTQPPSRYSEAKLVQLMEKLGIGRPSTYASTVLTLRERDYVVLNQLVLAPTALGMATDAVLMRAMPDLVDVKFTAKMEASLDQIAEGQIQWEKFLVEWNFNYLQTALLNAQRSISEDPGPRAAPASRPSSGKAFVRRSGKKSVGRAKRRS